MIESSVDYIQRTKDWLERLVIGLNLCPFAKLPFNQNRIRYLVERTNHPAILMDTFLAEALKITESAPKEIETTLIIHPNVLQDFSDYLDFLENINEVIDTGGLSGIIQVASFHPAYQFADTQTDEVENYTNRSPFPMLHLLREESIEKALENYPNPEEIPNQNIEKMKRLGIQEIRKILNQH